MLVSVKGKNYVFRFRHSVEVKVSHPVHDIEIRRTYHITDCAIIDPDDKVVRQVKGKKVKVGRIILIGRTVKSLKDSYNRVEGNRQAFSRAVQNLSDDPEVRQAFWDFYKSHCRLPHGTEPLVPPELRVRKAVNYLALPKKAGKKAARRKAK